MLRGEVWWMEFDPAADSETRKTRPGTIVSDYSANCNLSRVIVMPLTSDTDRLYPGEARVSVACKDSKAMIDQIMKADKIPLKSKNDSLLKANLQAVELALHVQLASPIWSGVGT